jgi:hypothetical protein
MEGRELVELSSLVRISKAQAVHKLKQSSVLWKLIVGLIGQLIS